MDQVSDTLDADRDHSRSQDSSPQAEAEHLDKLVQFNPQVLIHEDQTLPSDMSWIPRSWQPLHEYETRDSDEDFKFSDLNLDDVPKFEEPSTSNRKREQELLDCTMKQELHRLKKQEMEAQAQAKRGVSLVNQMKFEKSKIEAERDELKEEIRKLSNKIGILKSEHEKDLIQVKTLCSEETNQATSDLQAQLNSSLESQARLHLQLEQHKREKAALLNDVKYLKEQQAALQLELREMVITTKDQIVQASMAKNEALNELSILHHKLMKTKQEHHLERELLESTIEALQRRLGFMERDYLKSKEENVQLAEAVSSAQKESRQFSSDQQKINNSTSNTAQEHKQQCQKLTKLNTHYAEIIDQLENVLGSQRKLTQNLLRESFRLYNQLQEMDKQQRQQNISLRSQLEECNGKLEQSRFQRTQLQNQCEQHRAVQAAMEKQLQMLKEQLSLREQVRT